ncbi:MAG: DNA polymerase III subunit gamma/tau [Balneolaceae bacterium]
MAQNYRALTRTYRPQTFDDIVSQEHVSSTLKNAIKQNRISHAYMFCGPRGVGKTTMARVLARAVNEINENVDGESLNQTLNIVEMDAASNRKIEDVRQLKDVIRVPPQNGKYKIFIIDEVHMLTKEAFNALLKTLEEPPAHAIFIFATTEPHKVLPTILSRVQRFDFRRISVEEIVNRLKSVCRKEQITIDDESLHIIAKKADGALRDALGLMDQAIAFCGTDIRYSELLQALNVVGHDRLFEFTNSIEKKDATAGLTLIDTLLKEGTDIQEFLVSMTEHIRNLYVAKQGTRMHMVEATADTKTRYTETAKAFSEDDLMRMLHLVSEAQLKTKDVQQPRIHFEILMLKLIHMSRSNELNILLKDLEQLKKKRINQPGNTAPNGTSPPAKNGSEKVKKPDVMQVREPEYNKDSDTKNGSPRPAEPDSEKSSGGSEEYFLGKPSLGYAEGISSSKNTNEEVTVAEPEKKEQVVLKDIGQIEEYWKPFVNLVKEKAPQMIYFQLLRAQPKELRGNEVLVTADNEFATNLIEENQKLISSLFKQLTGIHIRLKCLVVRPDKKQEGSLSPYERFKELQKKDPHLRSIVELFGAELEY